MLAIVLDLLEYQIEGSVEWALVYLISVLFFSFFFCISNLSACTYMYTSPSLSLFLSLSLSSLKCNTIPHVLLSLHISHRFRIAIDPTESIHSLYTLAAIMANLSIKIMFILHSIPFLPLTRRRPLSVVVATSQCWPETQTCPETKFAEGNKGFCVWVASAWFSNAQ